jgi:4-amino-4-deoxy-L-arabinose transferase-like glycosyltransferase
LGQLLAFAAALVVSGGWWVAVVELVPASMRPYVGGSQDNSILNLIFGYNGFGRLTGDETGSVGGGPAGQGGRWGPTGWGRLFNADYGGQISWLLPAALIVLGAGLVLTWRAPRTDRTRASLLLWGGWLVVTGAVFSLGRGIIHSYYTVALAPAIGALVGIMTTVLWRRRHELVARVVLAATTAVTALWAHALLSRTPAWLPWLRTAVLVGGLAAAAAMLVADRLSRARAKAVVAAGLVAALAGPAAYSVATAATVHSGALPSAGPQATRGFGPGGPGGRPGGGGMAGPPGGGTFGGPGRAFGTPPTGAPSAATGGIGGLLNGSSPSAELVDLLEADSSDFTWVAAAVGANQASGYQLASGEPVMAIGGFNGTDPAPTLAQFQSLVAEGRIHWFIAGGQGGQGGPGGGPGGSGTSSEIATWVESTFTSTTVSGVTLYDLTSPV